MTNNIKYCTFPEHSQSEARMFCQECKIYMCNKCENTHQNLFKNHNLFKLDKNNKDIFTGFCKEANHINELYYDWKIYQNIYKNLLIN